MRVTPAGDGSYVATLRLVGGRVYRICGVPSRAKGVDRDVRARASLAEETTKVLAWVGAALRRS